MGGSEELSIELAGKDGHGKDGNGGSPVGFAAS